MILSSGMKSVPLQDAISSASNRLRDSPHNKVRDSFELLDEWIGLISPMRVSSGLPVNRPERQASCKLDGRSCTTWRSSRSGRRKSGAITSQPIQGWWYRRTVPHPLTIPQRVAITICRSTRPTPVSATVCSNSEVFPRRIPGLSNSARRSIHRCIQRWNNHWKP